MTLDELEDLLRDYFQGKRDVLKVILFGSFAEGTNTRRSDVDIAVIMDTRKRFLERYDDFSDLYATLRMPVDLIIWTPQEVERIKHRPFVRDVLAKGKVIYERGEE